MAFLILLDNGHGESSPKGSPDGSIKEWECTRQIVNMLYTELRERGYEAIKLTPETKDVPLSERIKRANDYCKKYGAKNTLLISVHLNAAGNGTCWMGAQGFSAHISNNASANSKKLARLLWEEALKNNMKGNRYVPAEKFIMQNLAICRETNCPAVLTENLFMDNKGDAELLLSMSGKIRIVRAHVDAIIRYVGGL